MGEDPAAACAVAVAALVGDAVAGRGAATLAVSGGSTAPSLFGALAALALDWDRVEVWQVDERVAPDGDPSRNASQLRALGGRHHLMPVTDPDLPAAARRYAAGLPARFDVVHLGMGDDGHTASWPPGDSVADAPEPVALSRPYQGRVRMTLTPPVVNAAAARVVLLTGAGKAAALAAWVTGRRPAPPIARVEPRSTVVFADPAAARLLPPGAARR